MEDFEAFARLVTALRPWVPGHSPLRTRDTDIAFSPDAALAGDVRTALAEAGFTEEQIGDDAPPATHYRLREEDAGFYAEFLTPLYGSGVKRDGKPDATVSKAGITAQKMRYLDLLLVSPWSVRVGPERGVPITTDVNLFVPNPTSFIVQKLLIHPDRPPGKRAQDVLYIHDTLELFGASLGELHRLWMELARPPMAPKTARRVQTVARELFAAVTDTIREAARIPQDRRLAPENVQRACEYGLQEILGSREPTL